MEKRNKKQWTWKSKFWRKKRSRARWIYQSAPKSFYHIYVERGRVITRDLISKLSDVDYDDGMLEFPMNHRHSANWDFW